MFYAGGFLYNSKTNEVLLQLRDNKTKNNPKSWAFFGGLAEENETPEETFKREVLEELNISIDKVKYLRDYFNPDFNTHRYVYFVQLEEKPNLQLNEGEKAEWFRIDKAFKIKLSKRTKEDLLYFKKQVSIIN